MFERGSRGVKLTDAGTAFLPYVERLLQTLREGRDAVGEVRQGQKGTLRLGSAPTISTYVLPRHSARLLPRSTPASTSSSAPGAPSRCLGMLLADDVQVGLVRSLTNPDVETIHLYEDEIVLVAHPAHPFAARRPSEGERRGREPIVLFDRGSSYYGLINNFFRRASVIPNVAMELDSLEATKRMVEEGLGIALVPLVTIERELETGALVKIDLTDVEPIKRPISLIHRKNRKRSRTVQAFVEMMSEAYSKQPVA